MYARAVSVLHETEAISCVLYVCAGAELLSVIVGGLMPDV